MEFTAEERARIRVKLTDGSTEIDWGHETPCWRPMWTTGSSPDGRASIWWSGRYYAGDRLAYMAWIGPLGSATRLQLTCHTVTDTCRTTPRHCEHVSCINPDHLEPQSRPGERPTCQHPGCTEPRNPPFLSWASYPTARHCLYHRVAARGWGSLCPSVREEWANRWVRGIADRLEVEYPPDPILEPDEYAEWLSRRPVKPTPPSRYIPDADRARVFTRDGWRCAICRRAMLHPEDPRLSGPLDPRYPTIDHHMPVSLGGTNELANLRAAHRVCNIRRGNRMHNEQFALFG